MKNRGNLKDKGQFQFMELLYVSDMTIQLLNISYHYTVITPALNFPLKCQQYAIKFYIVILERSNDFVGQLEAIDFPKLYQETNPLYLGGK